MFALRSVSRIATKSFVTPVRCLATIKFAPSHEYIQVNGDIGTIGITQHAADALGNVVFVELPSVGSTFSQSESFGAVESVKAASDVYVPVEGEVIETNSEVADNNDLINSSPMEKGWLIKIKLSETGKEQLANLLDEAAYNKMIEE